MEKKCGLKNIKAKNYKNETETYYVPIPMSRRMRFVGQ